MSAREVIAGVLRAHGGHISGNEDKILAALAAAGLVVVEWQPIETAPRDGRPILIARHMGEFGWVRGWAHWEDVRGISGWIARGFFEHPGVLGLTAPTHWMPLPAPPAASKEPGA